jgi:ABC-type transport system substrate-binding protein
MRWGVAVLAVSALTVLALGACSGDDGDSTVDTNAPTAPAPTTRAPAPTPAVTVTTTSVPATVSVAPTTVRPTTEPAASVATSAVSNDEWCLRAAELNQLAGAFRELDATDRDAVEHALAEILDRLDRIEAVVPGRLAGDLAVSAEAFRLLEAALDDVDFDIAAADFTELDERRPAIVAANSRIRVYNHDECGLDAGVTGAEVP